MRALVCLGWLLAAQPPAEVRFEKTPTGVEVVAPVPVDLLTKLPQGKLDAETGELWLRVGLLDPKTDRAGPPMLGSYERRGARIVFHPRFALEAGRQYRAFFGTE